ncbi:DUF748 domain-containing protein [Microbulbifer salipaludis]|uniref:DUF748 domain-containing protein n=1 Tax=Microbulbifer salipaludis TaxID=187980 RepID=A0ABS3E598_9GAMM|nr:DUF748 domain-containing protein [Microbulbifer salipaludis]MBN8430452.1 DUF748 domain-containing protein [Microbulbifer salipaludis]
MSTSSANPSAEYRGARRLLWLLVFALLLIGALNILVAVMLPGAVQRWLQERGLEAQIEHIDVSLPRLRTHLRGVSVRNESGRGFNVQEATLGLSWWQLLQGKIHVNRVELDGAYLDLVSSLGEYGRVWEIGGWRLKEGGEKKPKDWRVDLTAGSLRNTVVCYQHKPQWATPSCARIGSLNIDDFFVSGLRELVDEPLQFLIGADKMALDNVLAWDELPEPTSSGGAGGRTRETGAGDRRKSAQENPILAVVRFKTRQVRFERPANRLSLSEATTRKFAACLSERWGEAVPGLRRVTSHCGTTRRLQVRGPASFSFGKQSEVAWYRINGQEVRLRYQNRRHPNWHAETIAINDFDFVRDAKSLQWQSAGASGFSWCPNRLRTGTSQAGRHHYCIRAGSLRLPQPTIFAWQDGFRADLTEASLTQGTVVDLDAPRPPVNPFNANNLRLASLQYRNDRRRLGIENLSLDGASGCIPGQLWGRVDHCVQLNQWLIPETINLQFAREIPRENQPAQRWAVESGPFSLKKFKLWPADAAPGDVENQLLLANLDWRRMELSPSAQRYLLEDLHLQALQGCVPDGWLPQRLSPLCGQLQQLRAEGDFVFAGKPEPSLVLGELALDSLLLSDHLSRDPDAQTGLVLQKLSTGNGLFRLRRQVLAPGEYVASGDGFGWFAEQPPLGDALDDGAEKGRLPGDAGPSPSGAGHLAGRPIGRAVAVRTLELELDALSLAALDGCLPVSWRAATGGGGSSRRPACFAVHNLQQNKPLQLAVARQWGAGDGGDEDTGGERDRRRAPQLRVLFAAADLSLERADVHSADQQPLLTLSQLRLPSADFRLQSHPARMRLDLPGAALDNARFCLAPSRCVAANTLRTGTQFAVDYGPHQFSANIDELSVDTFSLSGSAQDTTLDIRKLAGLELAAKLPRTPGARTDWKIQVLTAEAIDLCLPLGEGVDRMLPRCVRGRQLSSANGGLSVANLTLHHRLDDPAQLQLGALSVEKVGMVQAADPGHPLALNLHNLRLQSADGCGLKDWLGAAAVRADSSARWRGCLSTGGVYLRGDNLVSLGSGDQPSGEVERLALGPLQASKLQLSPVAGTPLKLDYLEWQSMRWSGGARVQVEDALARDFSGCLPEPGRGRAAAGKDPLCFSFAALRIDGTQQLLVEDALRASGRIAMEDFAFRQGQRKRLGFTHLGLDGLALSRDSLALNRGEVTGLNGCFSAFRFGEKPLAPCYEVGKITIGSEHRVQLGDLRSGLAQRQFRDIKVDGLRVTQRDFPQGLPSELLHVGALQADVLGFGQRALEGKNLQLENVSSCIPPGYIRGVRNCVHLDSARTSGKFSFEQRRLDLPLAQLEGLMVIDVGGDQLLETAYIEMRELTVAKSLVRMLFLEIADSRLLRRDVRAQEYVNHQWNTEIEALRVSQFEYFPADKMLQIDTVDVIRPRSILARGREGKLGAWERFRNRGPDLERYRYQRADRARNANRFRYRVRQLYVDRGDFLWLDNTHEYHAHLPVRQINLLLQGLSNYHQDPPAMIVFNASPGGFSEMHLAGQINLLEDKRWDAGVLGYVEGANLIPATPYMAGLLGYKILQGQLDAVVNIAVDDNAVNALANMDLQKIKVRRVREADHLAVKKSLIPLSLALALMKDGDGDVRFDMPVTGDLYDPKFSFSFIFSDLLQRAILEALFAYFTPIGFYSLAKLAWARFRAVEFSDLEFTPGSDTLSATAKAQLNGMLEKMRDNQKARPGICAVATAPDLEILFPHEASAMRGAGEARENFYKDPPRGIREELSQLSNRRSRAVQQYLIDAGLDQEDFIQCAPDYIGTDNDAPRVEFSN